MKISALVLLLAVTLCVSCTRSPQQPNFISPRAQQLANECAAALNATNYSKAQILAGEATSIEPQFAEAWVSYGMASLKLGQIDRAREAYERALSLHQARHLQNPSDANQVIQQIFLLGLLNRSDEAEKLLHQARIDYPNDQTIAKLAENFTETKQDWKNWAVGAK